MMQKYSMLQKYDGGTRPGLLAGCRTDPRLDLPRKVGPESLNAKIPPRPLKSWKSSTVPRGPECLYSVTGPKLIERAKTKTKTNFSLCAAPATWLFLGSLTAHHAKNLIRALRGLIRPSRAL